jgi:hypothetical protein
MSRLPESEAERRIAVNHLPNKKTLWQFADKALSQKSRTPFRRPGLDQRQLWAK